MANTKLSAILCGVGSPEAVAAEHCNRPTSEGGHIDAINDLTKAANDLMLLGDGREITLALMAAYANQDFRESGRLFRVNTNGRLDSDYHGSGETRETIADLAGL